MNICKVMPSNGLILNICAFVNCFPKFIKSIVSMWVSLKQPRNVEWTINNASGLFETVPYWCNWLNELYKLKIKKISILLIIMIIVSKIVMSVFNKNKIVLLKYNLSKYDKICWNSYSKVQNKYI